MNKRSLVRGAVIALVHWLIVPAPAQAQAYDKVFSFTDARADDFAVPKNRGSTPNRLLQDTDGDFYATTFSGGTPPAGSTGAPGTVFKITPNGTMTTLVQFTGLDGINKGGNPLDLVQGKDGNFYGTTLGGGTENVGTVFKVTRGGALTTLKEFATSDVGFSPTAGLVMGSDYNFYGTTLKGGGGGGTVFRITPAGVLTSLVSFTGNGASNKGSSPNALINGRDGNFYGTTRIGGANNLGTVFKMTPAGVLTTLVQFSGNGVGSKGSKPSGNLLEAGDGNFYGTTGEGGVNNLGTLFKMTPAGVLTTLVEFTGNGATNKGSNPLAGLVEGGDGSFYGTTNKGGAANLGTAFKVTQNGVLTTLVEFTGNGPGSKGALPRADLAKGADGNFYGTTDNGGALDNGTIFRMSPAGILTTLAELTGIGASDYGTAPYAGLVKDSSGNFYGTTRTGGTMGFGTIFKITTAGVLTNLVEFTKNGVTNKGSGPTADLVQGDDGNFYGTTRAGGANNFGTIFKMTPAGELQTLVEFTGTGVTNKGTYPYSGLTKGNDGNFYGTTSGQQTVNIAPIDTGTIFKMTPAGNLTTLVQFTGNGATNKGRNPFGTLVLGTTGLFYGTTLGGGGSDVGTVFKMTPAGVLTTLVEFTGNGASNKGSSPFAGLVEHTDGNFYGTTAYGGGFTGGFFSETLGTIFKMTPAGVLTTLVQFTGNGATNKGSKPEGALVKGGDGNFYGTARTGGASEPGELGTGGTVFKMTPGGVLTTLVDLGIDLADSQPRGRLFVEADGNVYGTTSGDSNANGSGAIFRLIFSGKPSVFPLDAEPKVDGSVLVQVKVNARGSASTVTLEYGTDGVAFPNSSVLSSSLAGFETTLLGTTLIDLPRGVTHYYRIRATNSFGSTVSPVASFTTIAPPFAAVNGATNILPTSATLNGIVNAHTYDTTVTFEYGTDGNSFPNPVTPDQVPVTGNTNKPVSKLVGLAKGTTYYYRVVATNIGGTVVSGVSSFTTLTEPTATVGGATLLSTISASVTGSVNARSSDAQVFFEYGTNGINFPNSVSATPPSVSADSTASVSAELLNLTQGTTYYYRIRARNAGGLEGFSAAATFTLGILSGLTQTTPTPRPSAQGSLTVTLLPAGINSGWRFIGEQQWRPSGVAVNHLTDGDRQIEFRPVPGYIQPVPQLAIHVPSAPLTFRYYQTTNGSNGELVVPGPGVGWLRVYLTPGEAITAGAQWRLLGEDDAHWRNSGENVVSPDPNGFFAKGLLPGNYLIECKPVPGRTTPVTSVTVQAGQTGLVTLTYFQAEAPPPTATPPAVLQPDSIANPPYCFLGQIRTDLGSATGFVVKPNVVATAAHVVFDDALPKGKLSYVTGVQWLLQNYSGSYEPQPRTPRGFYLFGGYAAQRVADEAPGGGFSPGNASPASRNLDVAALYFLNRQDAGRGGSSGFLASDSADNEFLISEQFKKFLAGYPVDGPAAANQGRMFATPPDSGKLERVVNRVYKTEKITSYGGNSGGPLFVQRSINEPYYPAAIYLGGSASALVRAIDAQVVDLFDRAQLNGDAEGEDHTGGGIIQVDRPPSANTYAAAALLVKFEPAAAAGATWTIGDDGPSLPGGGDPQILGSGPVTLHFSEVQGFLKPPDAPIILTGGLQSEITRYYFGITEQPSDQTVPAGTTVTFNVTVSENPKFPAKYQWRKGGMNIPDETKRSYTVTASENSTYSVLVTWAEGDGFVPLESRVAELKIITATPTATPTATGTPAATPTATPGLVGNVSTRLPVGSGDNALIEGFIVQGPAGSTKKILVRAIGPSLASFGISDALANPTLEIRDANNAIVATNDDWKNTQVGGIISGDQSAAINASQLAPGNDLESAIIADLAPGSYTAVVRGAGNTIGTGVVDAYDISPTSPAKLANIATRGLIQPGDKLMIAGFIVQNAPAKAVVRAVGPSLKAFGIANALADTTLELRDQNGALVLKNDDWQSDQKQELEATLLQPTDSLEAAMVVTVPPGPYTAQVRGKPESTGIGVVQVYFLQ